VHAADEGGQAGHFKVVKYLLCCYADVDARDRKDRTPLMLAASSGSAKTVECVLHSNPKVNAKDKDGWTALMYAAKENHRDVVKALLATPDIDRRASNRHGLTAEDLTTCPILKGLLRENRGVGLGTLATDSAPDLKPPPVGSRSSEDRTLATFGPGPSSSPPHIPVKAPPAEVGGATCSTGFPPPAVDTVAHVGPVGRESRGAGQHPELTPSVVCPLRTRTRTPKPSPLPSDRGTHGAGMGHGKRSG
jgi:ankyrin repeat protein